jgi:hypothetical protein
METHFIMIYCSPSISIHRHSQTKSVFLSAVFSPGFNLTVTNTIRRRSCGTGLGTSQTEESKYTKTSCLLVFLFNLPYQLHQILIHARPPIFGITIFGCFDVCTVLVLLFFCPDLQMHNTQTQMCIYIYIYIYWHAVAQLVEALRYKLGILYVVKRKVNPITDHEG